MSVKCLNPLILHLQFSSCLTLRTKLQALTTNIYITAILTLLQYRSKFNLFTEIYDDQNNGRQEEEYILLLIGGIMVTDDSDGVDHEEDTDYNAEDGGFCQSMWLALGVHRLRLVLGNAL